ncbi:MAG: hypothetical protein H9535_03965 [Ignavibacteria bacterium]|nr:hypothetical protein [Ignavibacteria bacterium]
MEWGEGNVFIDSLINDSFMLKLSQAGGTRLIAPAKASLVLSVIAPNPVKNVVHSLKQEMQSPGEYTLNAKIS